MSYMYRVTPQILRFHPKYPLSFFLYSPFEKTARRLFVAFLHQIHHFKISEINQTIGLIQEHKYINFVFKFFQVFVTNSDISNPCIFVTQCRRPWIFQTINYVRSNNLNLKFTSSCCKIIFIRKFEFVAKTQFLY